MSKPKTERPANPCDYYPHIEINSDKCKAETKLSCENCRHMGRRAKRPRLNAWDRTGEQ